MEQRTKELIKKISKLDFYDISRIQIEDLVGEAQGILFEHFKKEVIELYEFILSWNSTLVDSIINNNQVGFIHESYYKEEIRTFLNSNFDKIQLVIDILRHYLEERVENNG